MSVANALLGGMMKLGTIHHVRMVPRRSADGDVARAYELLRSSVGFVPPPLALHSPHGALFLASSVVFAEIVLAGSTPRRLREIVASAVSAGNRCPYCVDAHTMVLHALADHDSARALDGGGRGASDPLARRLMAAVKLPAPDNIDRSDLNDELINVAICFHYVNRMVNVFLGESPLPVAPPAGALRRAARRSGGPLMSGMAHSELTSGQSLAILGDAARPAAKRANPGTVALRHLERTCEGAVRKILPRAVRDLVDQHLGRWRGEHPAMDGKWLADAVADLAEADRPAARLALLSALASWRVDKGVIEEFRGAGRSDADIIAVTSWASLRAARAAGKLLAG